MKRILAALVLGLALLSPAGAVDKAKLNQTIDQTNFLVGKGCSGTLIDAERGFILTAHHCITNNYRTVTREKVSDDGKVTEEKIRVVVPGEVHQKYFANSREIHSKSYVYKVIASDANYDLALLKIDVKLPATPAKFACKEPERGDVVFAVGNPGVLLYSSVTQGIVSSVDRSYLPLGIDDQNDERLVQISPGIIGGNSGGSVYNEAVELIGVPVRASRMNEVLGFAVPLKDIRTFLERQGAKDLFKHCD